MTNYPNNIDSLTSLPKVIDLISPIRANDHNSLRDAIVAIQTELGTNPSGTFGTVKDRLDDIFEEFFAGQIKLVDADGYFSILGPDGYKTVETALSELAAELQALNAQDIPIIDSSNNFTATTVEGALQENFDSIDNLTASSIPIVDSDGYFASTNVEDALAELAASNTSGTIGPAEDGIYSDGLFEDFVSSTPVGTAVDRFNEVLKQLAPSPAPALSDIGFSTSIGPEGKVSFGASNSIGGYTNVGTAGGGSALDINDTFTSASGTALRKGIYDDSTNKSGAIAEGVSADMSTPTPAYPANSFGDGYDGYLQLELNGSVIHSIDLSSFGSGSSLNANGSGFQNVSAGTPVSFPNGSSFEVFYYRTADWIVSSADEVNGYNYVRVIHNNSPTFSRATNYFEWVVDDSSNTTVYSGEQLTGLSMLGSNNLSGVEYYTSGSATYEITIQNPHRNTYSTSASAISHTGTNVDIPSSFLGNIASEAEDEIISKTATINTNILLDGSISATTSVDRTIDANEAVSSGASPITGILLYDVSSSNSATFEDFNDENFRLPSDRDITDISGFTLSGANLWDSSIEIYSVTPSNSGYDGYDGYDAGLLSYNGTLYYPNNASVVNSGNFSVLSNGPPGNPNYISSSGQRVYLRYFYFSTSSSNFTLNINGSATLVSASAGPSSSTDEVSIEFLLPNTTTDGSSIEFKDSSIPYTTDNSVGCYAATFGSNVGNFGGADWGISFGGKNTSTSGNAVVIKITVGDGWTGNIDDISFDTA